MVTRAERYAQVKALRDRGLLLRQICAETGLARSTVSDLLCDPTGDLARARKAKRHGICVDCGAETFNSGSEPPKRCRSCLGVRQGEMDVRRGLSEKLTGQVQWTDEQILSLVRRNASDGRISTAMWNTARAANPALMPSLVLVRNRFDTWGELCALAGVKTVRRPTGPRVDRIPAEECLRWVQRCADDIGRVPPCWVYEAWQHEHDGAPSANTVRKRFGNWLAVAERVELRESVAA